MGAEGVFKMVKGAGLWDVSAQQRVPKLPSAKASPRSNPPKPSPRSLPRAAPRVSILNSPRKVAAELSVFMLKLEADFMAMAEGEGREKWRCLIREGSLIEDWLPNMLQKAGPVQTAGEKGLQEYGLSRLQLGVLGLSEAQIDRAYRMLYVYSVGCHQMIKELCLHSLEKSLLVGCLWRAFIRLCEGHSKIELQAEIAELMEEKQNAIDELRLTRGCLNEALDGLAMKKLLASDDVGTFDDVPASTDDSNKENDQVSKEGLPKRKSTDPHVQSLIEKCETLSKEREQLLDQIEDTSRMLRMEHAALELKEREKTAEVAYLDEKMLQLQGALDKEKKEVQRLREYSTKLEHDIEETERRTGNMTWKFVQYERDFPALQKEVAEYKQHGQKLEQLNEQYKEECSRIKETNEKQEAAMTRLRKQLETYEKAVRDLKAEATERRRLFEEKAREASLTGEEVDAWIKGHEALLAQQLALLAQVEQLKKMLETERRERYKEKHILETRVQSQQDNLRALTLGIASLTPRRTGGKARKSTIAEVNFDTESRSEKRLSRRLTRKLSRKVSMQQQQPQDETGIPATIEEISEDQTSDEEWDELCCELSQQREAIEKLEAEVKEERDRRIWMERSVEDTVKQLEKLQLELDQTNLRVVNLALEKKNKERNLQNAEDQIRKLDRQLANVDIVLDSKNREIDGLKDVVAKEIQRQAGSACDCKQLLTAGVKELQGKMVRQVDIVGGRINSMMSRMRELRSRVAKAGTELKSWKLKTKAIDNKNVVLLAELKTFKSNFESLNADNMSLGYRLQKEEQAKAKAESELAELIISTSDIKLDQAVLEVQLESAVKGKLQSDLQKEKLQMKLTECVNNLAALQHEKEKEDTVRGILQADVDALRLELEALKRVVPPASKR